MAPNTWAVTVATAGLVLILATLYGNALTVNQGSGTGVLLAVGIVVFLVGLLLFGVVGTDAPEI